jgi:hypothetical protein
MKRLVLALTVIGSLLFAAGASASGGDRNGDRIPDRWEKRHSLSLEVNQARRDQDRDGLKNRGEWRAKTDPRAADSDDDGIDDADENAGTVTAYADGVLTITLFAGGEALTAAVTDETDIQCGCDDRSSAVKSDDPGDDDEHGDRDDDEHGDRDDERHGGWHDDDGSDCDADALAVGALVEEADLKVTADGKVWDEIELR